MGDATTIEWTDSTFNPWIGCTKISPACDHCYAEALNAYRRWTEWGAHGERRRTSPENWRGPRRWNANAERFQRQRGRRQRVFCASLADVFDNQVPREWRADLFTLIRDTPELDWQILTKRPQNIAGMLPRDWSNPGWPNVWLGITAEDQTRFDQRWPYLRAIPSIVRFVSFEPALGSIKLPDREALPDWIISGGESGPKARNTQASVFRSIRDQCLARGIPFFHKQFGNYASNPLVLEAGRSVVQAAGEDPPRNGKGGATLDGRLWRMFPQC